MNQNLKRGGAWLGVVVGITLIVPATAWSADRMVIGEMFTQQS